MQFKRSLFGFDRRRFRINQISSLLIRDWYEFKNNYTAYVVFWIITPILLHILLAIPLSQIIILEVRYLNWAAAGIWITSSSMMSFIETSQRAQKIVLNNKQVDAILDTPTSNYNILLSIILRGCIIGFIQFVFAISITCFLNNEYLSIFSIGMIVIQMIPIIIIFSITGTLISIIIYNRSIFIQIPPLLFIIISLGLGTFIPDSFYPETYLKVIHSIPIKYLLYNVQSIIIHQNIIWTSYFINYFLIVVLFAFSLIASNRNFRKL